MKNNLQLYLDSVCLEEELPDVLIRQSQQVSKILNAQSSEKNKLEKRALKLENQVKKLKKERNQLKRELKKQQSDTKKKLFRALKRRLKKNKTSQQANVSKPDNNYQKKRSVSICIPTYRNTPYFKQAIESAFNQHGDFDLEVLVVVNGSNTEWAEQIKKDHPKARVVHTEKQGLSVARNYGIKCASKKCLLFLDDDDCLTSSFLQDLFDSWQEDTSFVCGKFFDEKCGELDADNYINRAIERLSKNNKKQASPGALNNIPGKLFSVEFLRSCVPFDESLNDTEDIIFWAQNYDKVSNCLSYSLSETEGYVRRLSENSMTRPDTCAEYDFFITGRIKIISILEKMLFESAVEKNASSCEHVLAGGQISLNCQDSADTQTNSCKNFIISLINAQTNFMTEYFEGLSAKDKEHVRAEVNAYEGVFLNKGLFSSCNAIAFCHNFAPDIDPSAMVATKRLREIDGLQGIPLCWHVFSKDGSDLFDCDPKWDKFYANFTFAQRIKIPGRTFESPRTQTDYAIAACALAKDIDAKVIYSRSMFVGSHLAAYLYKKAHPDVFWYAEFSDPVALDSRGDRRDEQDRYKDELEEFKNFYQNCEYFVYENADKVIFTNEVQREYMFAYCPDKNIKNCAMPKSEIWPHPIIDKCYVNLMNTKYEIDDTKINIGYFGSFFHSRKADEILRFAKRDDVVLHLFLLQPQNFQDLACENVRIEKARPYFEFLNLASRMDYLFINDTKALDGVTPWRPSKLSDYLASGSMIIALCNEDSPLSMEANERVIKLTEITDDFIDSLTKPVSN